MPYTTKQISEELAMSHLGLKNLEDVFWNLPTPRLYEHALRNREGHLADSGALVVRNGHFTGQAVKDKYIVTDALSDGHTWHGEFNHSFSEQQFEALFNRLRGYLEGRQLYVEDCLVAAGSGYDQPIRLITQDAWHGLFAKTMFVRPADMGQDTDFKEPAFTVIHAPHFHAVPARDGTQSEAFVILHLDLRIALIGGTAYAGEIKTTVFAMMSHVLTDTEVLPLHAAVNVAADGDEHADAAIFLGPEGSGKTTLASDPARRLLGDDIHGWHDKQIFSFEAGCYAKVNHLDKQQEPLIHAACQSFGTILENVGIDTQRRHIHFDDLTLTDNTRAAYSIKAIDEAAFPAAVSSPKHLILLVSDAFGVLPAISRLTAEQVMYYFLLGYSSHVPCKDNTDVEPEVIFSPCCGMPLMAHHPSMYAKILGAKVRKEKLQCWLLNTGWSGGPAGIGERMNIELTRTLLTAALQGSLDDLDYQSHPVFGLQMPDQLDPLATWHEQEDPNDYIEAAKKLAKRFNKAFAPFSSHMPADVRAAGPR